jgi:hypothetical protein
LRVVARRLGCAIAGRSHPTIRSAFVVPTNIKDKAEAAFKKRPRVGESAKTLATIQADRLVEDEKIERLKSLRLTRATAEDAAPAKPKTDGA